jgi:hypothetical protein
MAIVALRGARRRGIGVERRRGGRERERGKFGTSAGGFPVRPRNGGVGGIEGSVVPFTRPRVGFGHPRRRSSSPGDLPVGPAPPTGHAPHLLLPCSSNLFPCSSPSRPLWVLLLLLPVLLLIYPSKLVTCSSPTHRRRSYSSLTRRRCPACPRLEPLPAGHPKSPR